MDKWWSLPYEDLRMLYEIYGHTPPSYEYYLAVQAHRREVQQQLDEVTANA